MISIDLIVVLYDTADREMNPSRASPGEGGVRGVSTNPHFLGEVTLDIWPLSDKSIFE